MIIFSICLNGQKEAWLGYQVALSALLSPEVASFFSSLTTFLDWCLYATNRKEAGLKNCQKDAKGKVSVSNRDWELSLKNYYKDLSCDQSTKSDHTFFGECKLTKQILKFSHSRHLQQKLHK